MLTAPAVSGLQSFPGKLTVHEADLLKAGSFDDVVKVGSLSLGSSM